MKTQPSRVSKGLVAMATNFGTKIAINLVYMSDRQFVMEGRCVVGRQNADIAVTLHLTDVAMAAIFWLLYMECTLVPPVEYD